MSAIDGGLARPRPEPAEPDTGAGAPPPSARPHGTSRSWRSRLVIFAVAGAALMALFASTFASMVATWWRSETFAHGFVIGPIVLFLIWRQREALRRSLPGVGWLALIPLALLGALWLLGAAADVIGVQQFAVVAMIPMLVIVVFGWRLARRIAFPLAFLLLAVPIGEALVPPLIDFTALFTVNALQFTGVPVYWEGARFSIPSGDWSVVKACSGVRYLFATLTVTLLFAYLNFRSYWRRAAFVLLALGLAMLGNGLRAYAIVMIGHLSDMRLAVGVDHFIYGWVFFALLMVLIFWIGGFFRERRTERAATPGDRVAAPAPPRPWLHPGAAAVAALAVIGAFPAWAAYVQAGTVRDVVVQLQAPDPVPGWELSTESPGLGWQPRYVNPGAELDQGYRRGGGDRVGLHLVYYPVQAQDAELINFRNVLVPEKDPWHVVARGRAAVSSASGDVAVSEARLRSYAGELLVWQWYWVEGHHLRSPYMVKAYEALDRILSGRRRGAGIIVYTPVRHDLEAARARLQAFAGAALPHLDAALHRADGP